MNISELKSYYNLLYNKSDQNATSESTEATSTTGTSFSGSLQSLINVVSSQETDDGSDRDSYTSSVAQAYMPQYCDTYNNIKDQMNQSKPIETDQYLVSVVDASLYGGDIAITDKTSGETTYYSSDDLTVQEVEGTDLSYIVSADGESATIVDDQLKEALSTALAKTGNTLETTTVTADDIVEVTPISEDADLTTAETEESSSEGGSGISGGGSSSDEEDTETTTEIITMADGSRYLQITTTEGDTETVVRIKISDGDVKPILENETEDDTETNSEDEAAATATAAETA